MLSRATIFALVLGVLCVTGGSIARAETPPVPTSSGDTPTGNYWYQIVGVDALSVGLVFGTRFAEGPSGADTTLSDTMFVSGYLGGMLGAPVVHLAHGRPLRALASLGLHVLLPVLAQGVALGASGCHDIFCDGWGSAMANGWMVGMGVASAIDALLLTHSFQTAAAESPAPRPPARSIALSPIMGVSGQGAFAGMVGRF